MMFAKNQPMSFNGFKVVTSPILPYQRLKIRSDVPITDEFRAEMNKWLLDMFGKVDCLFMESDRTVVFSEQAYQKLKQLQQYEFATQLSSDLINGSGTHEPKGIKRSDR